MSCIGRQILSIEPPGKSHYIFVRVKYKNQNFFRLNFYNKNVQNKFMKWNLLKKKIPLVKRSVREQKDKSEQGKKIFENHI